MEINEVRMYAHVATASLLAALAIATWLVRGHQINVQHALLASGAFGLASLWFWLLSATVKDHAIISRTDLLPLLTVTECGFVALGWTWFIYMAMTTFTIKRNDLEVTIE